MKLDSHKPVTTQTKTGLNEIWIACFVLTETELVN